MIDNKEINNILKETCQVTLLTVWFTWILTFSIALHFNELELMKNINVFGILGSISLMICLAIGKLHEIKIR